MAPPVEPIASDEKLPARAAVVVIGGGIIGICTAFFLAQKGISVLVCEKGSIAAEQSSRNWGWCRSMGRDPREMPLILEAMRLWRGMDNMIGGETGFRQCGIAQFCANEAEASRAEAWLDMAQPYQLDTRPISGSAIGKIFGETGRHWAAVFHTSGDGRAEPRLATTAIAKAARRLGAAILTSCAVRGIETRAGRIEAVVTEKGRVACDVVVLAGGIWSRLFCGNIGLALSQLKVMTSVLRTAPLGDGPESSAIGTGLAFRKEIGGGYIVSQANRNVVDVGLDHVRLALDFRAVLRARWSRVKLRAGRQALKDWLMPRRWALDRRSPFEMIRVMDPDPYEPFVIEALRNAANAFPFFRKAKIAETWAGFIDVTPDVCPIISPVEKLPGFFIATGFSGHGFGIGPGAGKLMADLVAGGTTFVDPEPFRFERYQGPKRPQPSPLAL